MQFWSWHRGGAARLPGSASQSFPRGTTPRSSLRPLVPVVGASYCLRAYFERRERHRHPKRSNNELQAILVLKPAEDAATYDENGSMYAANAAKPVTGYSGNGLPTCTFLSVAQLPPVPDAEDFMIRPRSSGTIWLQPLLASVVPGVYPMISPVHRSPDQDPSFLLPTRRSARTTGEGGGGSVTVGAVLARRPPTRLHPPAVQAPHDG